MSKTNFIDGSPVTPSFLNAINNPTYSENPSENGEIPVPTFGISPKQGLPINYCLNSSMCGQDPTGNLALRFASVNNFLQSYCAGMLVGAKTTNLVGSIFANTCGDPSIGFWAWNVAGNDPQSGDTLEYFLSHDFNLMNGIENRDFIGKKDTEFTFQVEVKNNAAANGGTASTKVSINVQSEDDLIANEAIEIVNRSESVVLSSGQSAILWLTFRLLKNNAQETTFSIGPAIKFEQQSGGNLRHEFRSLSIFSGDSFGVPLRQNSDAKLASLLAWSKNKTISPIGSISGFVAQGDFVLTSLKALKYPDNSIRLTGKVDSASGSGGIIAVKNGNPLGLPVNDGDETLVLLGRIESGLIHVSYYEPSDQTRIVSTVGFSSETFNFIAQNEQIP